MKKILLIVAFFAFVADILGQGNMPVNQPIGTINSENYTNGLQGANYGYRFRSVYADTTALNALYGGLIKTIPGVLARAGNKLYLRDLTSQYWIEQASNPSSFLTWYSLLTPLLSQAAVPIQPTDSLIVALGKLQAQYNTIDGSYIENQNSTFQSANAKIEGQFFAKSNLQSATFVGQRGSATTHHAGLIVRNSAGADILNFGSMNEDYLNNTSMTAFGSIDITGADTGSINIGYYNSNSFRTTGFNKGRWRIKNYGAYQTRAYWSDFSNYTYLLRVDGSIYSDTLTIGAAPTTSAGTYDFLTRNTSTGIVEKRTSASVFVTASNGLTVASNNVKLGGTLSENTAISKDIYSFQISGNADGTGIGIDVGGNNLTELGDITNNFQDAKLRVDGVNDIMYFRNNVNTATVGINKAAPTQALDVVGNVRFSGALMPNNTAGTSGQVLTSAGAGVVPTWATPTTGTVTGTGVAGRMAYWDGTSSITSSANNLYNDAPTSGNGFVLTNSAGTSGNLVSLTNTGTAAASNTKNVLALVSSGANATASQTVTGQTISVTNTGTTNTNVGLSATASGATNNYAILVPSGGGSVGIGTVTPANALQVYNASAIQALFNGWSPTDGAEVTTGAIALGNNALYRGVISYSGAGASTPAVYIDNTYETILASIYFRTKTSGTAINAMIILGDGSVTIPTSAAVLSLGGGATAAKLKFFEPSGSGSNYSEFQAVAQAGNITYSLPPTAVAGGVWTDVAGNGVLTSVAPATTTSGTYTPTLSNTTNVSASTARLCTYSRVGNMVTITGQFDIDPTGALAATVLGISLPIASNFTTIYEGGGGAWSTAIVSESAGCQANATTDILEIRFINTDLTNHTMSFQIAYEVK